MTLDLIEVYLELLLDKLEEMDNIVSGPSVREEWKIDQIYICSASTEVKYCTAAASAQGICSYSVPQDHRYRSNAQGKWRHMQARDS